MPEGANSISNIVLPAGKSPDATDKRRSGLSLALFVRDQIRVAITNGQMVPGDRIRENDIASWLNVSRTPVREAIQHLEMEGLLESLPSRGTVVAQLDSAQLDELYTIRATLEGLAAALAARHISDTELSILRDLHARADATDDVAALADLNRKFHQTIYTASHNRYLVQLLSTLRSALALLKGTTYAYPGRRETSQVEHLALIDAIASGDVQAAQQAAIDHLMAAEKIRFAMRSEGTGA